jgi:fibronectin type 3 domain-containing protein
VVQKLENIAKTQQRMVIDVKETLGLTDDEAVVMLRAYKWNIEKLQEAWFTSENL